MAVSGIRSVYVETHDWREALAFWRALGFKLEEDLGRSGTLRAPDGGPYLFIEEVPADQPLQVAPWFNLTRDDLARDGPIEVVRPLEPTHWGTHYMEVRDPDGRIWQLEQGDSSEEPRTSGSDLAPGG